MSNRPRLSIDITPEQQERLNRLVPWGIRIRLFNVIVEDLIRVLEKHQGVALGMLLAGELKLTDYSRPLQAFKDSDNGNNSGPAQAELFGPR